MRTRTLRGNKSTYERAVDTRRKLHFVVWQVVVKGKIYQADLDTSDLFIGSHFIFSKVRVVFKIFHFLPCFMPLDTYNNSHRARL